MIPPQERVIDFPTFLLGDEQTYTELVGSGTPSVTAWEVAAARSRQRAAERHAHDVRARYLRALVSVYAAMVAAVALVAGGGLTGLL